MRPDYPLVAGCHEGRSRALALLDAAGGAGRCGAGRGLGLWQLSRAAGRRSRPRSSRAHLPVLATGRRSAPRRQAGRPRHRRITLQGRWMPAQRVPRQPPMDGRAGFMCLTPLALPDGDAVLVQRGWAPRDAEPSARLPAVARPTGVVTVEGRVGAAVAALQLGAEGLGAIRQNLDLDAFARETGLPLAAAGHRAGRRLPRRGVRRPAAPLAGAAFDVCTSTTAMPSSGSRSRPDHGALYVWFQLVRPRPNAVLPPAA